MAKTPAAEIPAQDRRSAGGRAPGGLRQALSARAVRRPEAARRDRPRAGHPSDGAAARRAARRARRQAARGDADRAHQPAEGSRHHVRLRDARPDRGARAVAPHRGDEPAAGSSRSTSRRRSTAFRRPASSPTSSAIAICCRAPVARQRGGIVDARRRRTGPGARRRDVDDRRGRAAGTIALRPEKIRIGRRRRAGTPATTTAAARSPTSCTWATSPSTGSTRAGGAKIEALLANSPAAAPSSSRSATRSR